MWKYNVINRLNVQLQELMSIQAMLVVWLSGRALTGHLQDPGLNIQHF